jgi:hypothetical protein
MTVITVTSTRVGGRVRQRLMLVTVAVLEGTQGSSTVQIWVSCKQSSSKDGKAQQAGHAAQAGVAGRAQKQKSMLMMSRITLRKLLLASAEAAATMGQPRNMTKVTVITSTVTAAAGVRLAGSSLVLGMTQLLVVLVGE